MFAVLLEHKVLSIAFITLLLLSIICQILIGVIYRQMIKETDNMSATNNKFLKQCKLKFINCYQLNEGVANISVFVDKFLSRISFMGVSLTGLQHLGGQFMLLSVVVAGIGACGEIVQGETVARVLPFYIVGFVGLYIYFSISGLIDVQGKRERLKTNLMDYLENHMVNKLRQSAIDWEDLTGEKLSAKSAKADRKKDGRKQETQEGVSDKVRALREELGLQPERTYEKKSSLTNVETYNDVSDKEPGLSYGEEQELEELLREFLV